MVSDESLFSVTQQHKVDALNICLSGLLCVIYGWFVLYRSTWRRAEKSKEKILIHFCGELYLWMKQLNHSSFFFLFNSHAEEYIKQRYNNPHNQTIILSIFSVIIEADHVNLFSSLQWK